MPTPVAPSVSDLLARPMRERCIGRAAVLDALAPLLSADRPIVAALHGLGGVGKTSVARAFAAQAAAQGVPVLWLDGQSLEPTPAALLADLALRAGAGTATLPDVVSALHRLGPRVLLVIDAYERCRLVDAWLRQELVPRLGLNMRLLLVGRDAPVSRWQLAPGWRDLFAAHELDALSPDDALALLRAEGLDERQAAQVQAFARGHPLVLKLAGGVVSARASPAARLPEAPALHGVLDTLMEHWLAEVADAPLRRTLQQVSVARRVTVSLLRALQPGADAPALFERLASLSFATLAADGLLLHDVVREAIAAHFRASDPAGCRQARRSAWELLRAESRDAPRAELWRYTADMLYMVEAPAVREGFFPGGSRPMPVEPAVAGDLDDILSIARQHGGPAHARTLQRCWERAPQCFSVTRGEAGQVTGFYCLAEAGMAQRELAGFDPVFDRWLAHWASGRPAAGDRALLLRARLADLECGQAADVEAALALDIKRHYVALRPHLRRLYSAVRRPDDFDAFLREAGFTRLPALDMSADGMALLGVVLDFGPGSVDGWLARLVARTLGEGVADAPAPEAAPCPVQLDLAARELRVDGARVELSPLEFALMSYLAEREGEAVKRGDLLDDVWGPRYEGGSNVIDVVVRSLRRKLGARAPAIETVVRYGYRFRQPGG